MSFAAHIPVSPFRCDRWYRLLRDWQSRADRLAWHFEVVRQRSDTPLEIHSNPKYEQFLDDFELWSSRLVEHPLKASDSSETLTRAYSALKQRGSVEDDCAAVFGFYIPRRLRRDRTPAELAFFKRFRDATRVGRRAELEYRLLVELRLRLAQGWFLVFDTLTVHPDCYRQVFSLGSQCWRDYIQRWRRAVGGRPFHRHFCVVERGSKTGRLHLHCLHFVRRLPRGCSDPNLGADVPHHREIAALKRYWRFGFSAPIAVRLGPKWDAFSRLGWRWPVERVGRRWLPVSSGGPERVAGYLVKYVVKAYESFRRVPWRTKMSNGLGLTEISPHLRTLRIKDLLQLVAMPRLPRIKGSLTERLPLSLVKRLAVKELMTRAPVRRRRLTWLARLESRPTLSQRYETLIRTLTSPNALSSGPSSLSVKSLPNTVGFDRVLSVLFPAVVKSRVMDHRGGTSYGYAV